MDKNFDRGGDSEYNYNTYMEPLYITKIVKVGTSLGIVIPINYLDATGLQRGDQVFLAVREDLGLIIKKVDLKVIS